MRIVFFEGSPSKQGFHGTHGTPSGSATVSYVRKNTLLAAKGGCMCTPLTSLDPPLINSRKCSFSAPGRSRHASITCTKGVTSAVLHHLVVIDISSNQYRTKAKLTILSTILTSKDPMIIEISDLMLQQEFNKVNTYHLKLPNTSSDRKYIFYCHQNPGTALHANPAG